MRTLLLEVCRPLPCFLFECTEVASAMFALAVASSSLLPEYCFPAGGLKPPADPPVRCCGMLFASRQATCKKRLTGFTGHNVLLMVGPCGVVGEMDLLFLRFGMCSRRGFEYRACSRTTNAVFRSRRIVRAGASNAAVL